MSDLVKRLRDSVDRGHPGHAIRLEAAAEIERLRKALQRIANGGTSVLISATLDECPINPDVLEQIVKDAVSALPPSERADADVGGGQ